MGELAPPPVALPALEELEWPARPVAGAAPAAPHPPDPRVASLGARAVGRERAGGAPRGVLGFLRRLERRRARRRSPGGRSPGE